MIDLRSDTVTRPTAAMRKFIAEAEVGDDMIDVDPTVERLEKLTAELLGKEAAIFMPSGSMTNQIAIRLHCDRGCEFICDSNSHVYNYEQAAFAQLSGIVARTVDSRHGVIEPEQMDGLIRPINLHFVRTRLVCLENTHNRAGGRIFPQDKVERICRWAHENGLRTHVDGARLWNAAAATGKSVAELSEPFDSVSVCYSKGLGAPVGSGLAGTREFIAEARRARKLFGGAMRQAGMIAAGALYALLHHRERLVEDHEHARRIGDTVARCEPLSVIGGEVETNIVAVAVDPSWGTAAQFADSLRGGGVDSFVIGPQSIRLVTHLDLSSGRIDEACEIIRRVADGVPRASGSATQGGYGTATLPPAVASS
ncbi:MAG: aminotransferase class I/II-fold pyridoxal phosphate-dependent enzyme [Planctomycetaceae bacterium]|nr:MAG: aminotransferase class I/II-fold pyridoxal phosphate-dependent enzyme [Planctomycetaceae bacterium]